MRIMCCECGVKQALKNADTCGGCMENNGEPIIRNPLKLNEDALGENTSLPQADGDSTDPRYEPGLHTCPGDCAAHGIALQL
jgi:hypothetical protein